MTGTDDCPTRTGHRSPGRPTTGKVHEIRFPDHLWEALGELAENIELSRAELIRTFCNEGLIRHHSD